MVVQTRLDLLLTDNSNLQVWAEFRPGWHRHISAAGGWAEDGGRVMRAALPLPLRERVMKEGTAPEVIRLAPGKRSSSSANHRLPTVVPESGRK